MNIPFQILGSQECCYHIAHLNKPLSKARIFSFQEGAKELFEFIVSALAFSFILMLCWLHLRHKC